MKRSISREDALAYVNRSWDAAREAKRRYWRERIERGGFREALRISDELRAAMLRVHPDWPTASQREEDLATHRRVAAALARTPKPAARKRAGRVR